MMSVHKRRPIGFVAIGAGPVICVLAYALLIP